MRDGRRIALLLALALTLSGCAATGQYAARSAYQPLQTDYKPQGLLEEIFYPSSEPGMVERRAFVYLPKDYNECDQLYPVFYLLHGARGNECVWIEKGNLLHNIDSLTACGAMLPTIVVLPNANQYDDAADYGNARLKSALEAFYEVDGTVESRFVEDVVRATDSLFNTIPDKEHRAIAGMSIGAMQAIHLSANFPDTFGYVGMFSPMVHSFLKKGPDNSFYKKLDRKQAVQFADPPLLYLIMIGGMDFFQPGIENWSKTLSRKGYNNEYLPARGGHEWYNWEAFCNEFMQRLWKASVATRP